MVAQSTEYIWMGVAEESHVDEGGGEGLRLKGKVLAVLLFIGGQPIYQGTQSLCSHIVSIYKGGRGWHE